MTTLSSAERTRLEDGLHAVCARAGLAADDARLLRYTMNAVYSLEGAGVVVRMTSSSRAALVTRVAEVAREFAGLDVPATRLAPGHEEAVHVDGWSATIWTLLPVTADHRHRAEDLAGPLMAIHAHRSLRIDLPTWDPVGRARERIEQVASMGGPELTHMREWAGLVGAPLEAVLADLRSRCDALAAALETTQWTLPRSVVHGDAHAGNLLRAPGGQPVLGDLDSVAIGPPEWDLIPAAHGPLRFGDGAAEHQALAAKYGLDVTRTPAWDTLRQVRELQLLTSVMPDLPGRPGVAQELAHRFRTVHAADAAARWHRFQ